MKCHFSVDWDGLNILTQVGRQQVLNLGQEGTTKEQATFMDNDCPLAY